MVEPLEPGTAYADWQNDLVVADYFDMFARVRAGEKVNRLDRNRQLQQLIGRTKGSIERKRMNISGVLDELDMKWMDGFAPNDHFQRPLADAVHRYLDLNPEWLLDKGPAEPHSPNSPLVETEPPALGPPPEPPREAMERIARKYNRAARDFQNRRLGYLGEQFIYHREKRLLCEAGLYDLADHVEWTSQERGDGVGYDILSFGADRSPRKIEVKTTNGKRTTPFFLTRTEEAVSREEPESWSLYRLYDFDSTPGLFRIQAPIDKSVHLAVENWRASF